MNKNRALFLLCVILAVLVNKTGIGTKEYIRQVNSINASLEKEKSRANVLNAEWAYLNRSDRLEKLADNYLTLSSIKPNQVITLSKDYKNLDLASSGLKYKVASVIPTKKPKKELI